jgi:hypothetical protein
MNALHARLQVLGLGRVFEVHVSPPGVNREAVTPLGELPGQFGHGPRAAAGGHGLLARCGAGLDPLGDALQDGGDAEQVVGQVEVPVGRQRLGRGEAGALAVAADVFVSRSECPGSCGPGRRCRGRSVRDVPGHAVVAEVGQRMAQRRQLPVQHGDGARLGGVEHHVVQAVVAVHDGHLALVARAAGMCAGSHSTSLSIGIGWIMGPCGDGGHVLLAPAADLALEVVARLAVAGQAALGELHRVQRRDHAVHLVVDLAALAFVMPGSDWSHSTRPCMNSMT